MELVPSLPLPLLPGEGRAGIALRGRPCELGGERSADAEREADIARGFGAGAGVAGAGEEGDTDAAGEADAAAVGLAAGDAVEAVGFAELGRTVLVADAAATGGFDAEGGGEDGSFSSSALGFVCCCGC